MGSPPPPPSSGGPSPPPQPPLPSKPPRPPSPATCLPYCDCLRRTPPTPKIQVLDDLQCIEGIITPKPPPPIPTFTATPSSTSSSSSSAPPFPRIPKPTIRRSSIVKIVIDPEQRKEEEVASCSPEALHSAAVKAMLEAINMGKLNLPVEEQDGSSGEELSDQEKRDFICCLDKYHQRFDEVMWETRCKGKTENLVADSLTPPPPFPARITSVSSDSTGDGEPTVVRSQDRNLSVKWRWERGMGISSSRAGWPPSQSKNSDHHSVIIAITKEGDEDDPDPAEEEEHPVAMGVLLDAVSKSLKEPEKVYMMEDDGSHVMDKMVKKYVEASEEDE